MRRLVVFAVGLVLGLASAAAAQSRVRQSFDSNGVAITFAASFANDASGLDVVGTGEPAGDAPSRALLWRRGAAPIALADPLDPRSPALSATRWTAICRAAGAAASPPARASGKEAAMWRGSAESFVDLTPDGAPIATASTCAAGFQAG